MRGTNGKLTDSSSWAPMTPARSKYFRPRSTNSTQARKTKPVHLLTSSTSSTNKTREVKPFNNQIMMPMCAHCTAPRICKKGEMEASIFWPEAKSNKSKCLPTNGTTLFLEARQNKWSPVGVAKKFLSILTCLLAKAAFKPITDAAVITFEIQISLTS
jgi:hypothetical protein